MSSTDQSYKESTYKLFEVLDVNKSGYIEEEELDNFLELMGESNKDERQQKIPVLLQQMDLDGDGRISFDEFYTVAKQTQLDVVATLNYAESTTSTSENNAEAASSAQLFEGLDQDGDGYVSGQDLANILISTCGVNEKDVDGVLQSHFLIRRKDRISKSHFITRNQGLIRRRSNLYKIFNDYNKAPLTHATSSINEQKRQQLWALFCMIDDDRKGTISQRELADALSTKQLDFLDVEDVDILEHVCAEIKPREEIDFDFLVIEFVVLSDTSNKTFNFQTAAKALSVENRKLRNRLSTIQREESLARESVQRKASAEQLHLVEEHENTQDELQAALDKITDLQKEKKHLEMELETLKASTTENEQYQNSPPAEKVETSSSIPEAYTKEDVPKLLGTISNLKTLLSDSFKELSDSRDEHEVQVEELSQKLSQLQNENDALSTKLSVSASQNVEAISDIRSITLEGELQQVKQQLESQKQLAFTLSDERDDYKRKYEEVTSGTAAELGLGNEKEQLEVLNTKLVASYANVAQLQRELEAAKVQLQSEGKDLQQAGDNSDVAALKRELLAQKRLVQEAKQKAIQAEMERDQAMTQAMVNSLQKSRQPSEAKLELDSVVKSSASPSTLQYIQAIAALKKENRTLKKTVKKLHAAYIKASKNGNGSTGEGDEAADQAIDRLKQELKVACGEIAQLTLDLEAANEAVNNARIETMAYRKQGAVSQDTVETEHLKQQLSEAHSRLVGAVDTMKKYKEHACVQVVVKKSAIHTKDFGSGKREEVSQEDLESDMFTYFTDANVKSLKTGPWTDQEDRVLLQSQLHVGGDWLEIAKHLPGRSDVDVQKRSEVLLERANKMKNNERISNIDQSAPKSEAIMNTSNIGMHNESIMSQRSEGTYDIAKIEQEEAEETFQSTRSSKQRTRVAVQLLHAKRENVTLSKIN